MAQDIGDEKVASKLDSLAESLRSSDLDDAMQCITKMSQLTDKMITFLEPMMHLVDKQEIKMLTDVINAYDELLENTRKALELMTADAEIQKDNIDILAWLNVKTLIPIVLLLKIV